MAGLVLEMRKTCDEDDTRESIKVLIIKINNIYKKIYLKKLKIYTSY